MAMFRKPKPQGFHFTPRYYDPEKEEREARIRRAMAGSGDDTDAMKHRISASFRSPRQSQSKLYKSALRRSGFRVIVILVVLLVLTLILLVRFLPQIEQVLD